MKFTKTASRLNEDLDRKNKIKSRVQYYRNAAQLDENDVITEDNIDEWALRKTCSIYNIDKDVLKDNLLESR